MGFSDATAPHVLFNALGVSSLYGPSLMAGISQIPALPAEQLTHLKRILFEDTRGLVYRPYSQWTNGYPDWNKTASTGGVEPLQENSTGWNWLQGEGLHRGRLWGGCLEVLEFLKGTEYWPPAEFWEGVILVLETSEEKPPVKWLRRVLRNYGSQGLFERAAGLIIGRPKDYSPEEKRELDRAVRETVADEWQAPQLPVITNFDFGHTDPKLVLPLGRMAEIDCDAQQVRLLESALA
jgi:muramoyltetrapeptide carboxypeptidase LdcA involved in peptidoglycan recycling